MVKTDTISLNTGGFTDVIDITDKVVSIVTHSRIRDGLVIVFCSGSTGSITTIEYEAGVIHDLQKAIGKIVPSDIAYNMIRDGVTAMVFLMLERHSSNLL